MKTDHHIWKEILPEGHLRPTYIFPPEIEPEIEPEPNPEVPSTPIPEPSTVPVPEIEPLPDEPLTAPETPTILPGDTVLFHKLYC
jgi:hypothetical protein